MHRAPILAIVLALAACAGAPGGARPSVPGGPEAGAPDDIRGEWLMTELVVDGEIVPAPDGVEGTLVVGRTRLGGTAFCNSFGGAYRLDAGRLEIDELLSTVMACSGDIAAVEGTYLRALDASDLRVTFSEGALVVTGDDVELRFVPRPPVLADDLVGTSWLLQGVSADGLGTIARGAPALLEFRTDGTFDAGTGCGAMSGTWDARPEGVSSSVTAREADCPAGLREQDAHVASVLGDGFDAHLSRGRLTLTTPEGRSVEYVDAADDD